MEFVKKVCSVTRQGLYNTLKDKRLVFLILVFILIYDSSVKRMLENSKYVCRPVGFLENYIYTSNEWLFLIIIGVGFMIIVFDLPKINGESIFVLIRTGKSAWLLGEVLTIIVDSFIYVFCIFIVCVAGSGSYSFVGNIWSDYTVEFLDKYEQVVPNPEQYIRKEVYMYYSPYNACLKCFILLTLSLALMGTIVLVCSIINMKIIGIVIDAISIPSILFFNHKRMFVTWFFPYPHAQLGMHNAYVFKKQAFPVLYSYIYLIGLQIVLVIIGMMLLKKKKFS